MKLPALVLLCALGSAAAQVGSPVPPPAPYSAEWVVQEGVKAGVACTPASADLRVMTAAQLMNELKVMVVESDTKSQRVQGLSWYSLSLFSVHWQLEARKSDVYTLVLGLSDGQFLRGLCRT